MLIQLRGMLRFYFLKALSKLKNLLRKKKAEFEAKVTIKVDETTSIIDPATIPKYVNQLPKPPVYEPFVFTETIRTKDKKIKKKKHLYFIDISEFKQQILPEGYPETTVWGYGGLIRDPETGTVLYSRSAPGATFEAIRNVPVIVKWINRLTGSHLFAVDPTLHWANPNNMPMDPPKPWPPFPKGFPEAQKPVPIVTHLHGGEVPSAYDGNPEAWFTWNGKTGPSFVTSLYTYPNEQEPTTLWYHDHALGITRLNVQTGLAGFYLLRQSEDHGKAAGDEDKLGLPSGKYEIPLAIQDRTFNSDGSLFYDNVGINPDIHPYWVPEFFGNAIMVNGKVWPNLNVDRHQYRFRLLNGSNARFYNLSMSNGMKFIQIGSDGGFLQRPVELSSLLLAPGERADILVDFSGIEPGTKITVLNDANAPFPGGEGDEPDPETVGQIMQFTVPANAPAPVKPARLPKQLNNIPTLIPNAPQRILTLNEVIVGNVPAVLLLNGQPWSAPVSELPRVGSTEEWTLVNLTGDTHPIHLHLVQFQLYNRQNFRAEDYLSDWEAINGTPPLNHQTIILPVEPYLDGVPIEPPDNEKGWKDTIKANPNQVTRIRVRFAPQDVPPKDVKPGKNLYPFDPALGPGYVWHCHILEHEDNEMMRPYEVKH